jgi:DNA-binding MarR family transcriptional regulator
MRSTLSEAVGRHRRWNVEAREMTAGNLSTHLRKLEDAGYVVTKAYQARTPVTYVAPTTAGRRPFEDYSATLRAMLD